MGASASTANPANAKKTNIMSMMPSLPNMSMSAVASPSAPAAVASPSAPAAVASPSTHIGGRRKNKKTKKHLRKHKMTRKMR